MNAPAIDPAIHPLARLKICAALYHGGAVEKQMHTPPWTAAFPAKNPRTTRTAKPA